MYWISTLNGENLSLCLSQQQTTVRLKGIKISNGIKIEML